MTAPLAATAAAITFGAVAHGAPSPTGRFALAALAAALAFTLVEVVLSSVLLRLLGASPWRTTVGHTVTLERLTVPLGLAGAAAGLVALERGWWLAALVLAPLPWVPEVVLAGRRRRGTGRWPVRRIVTAITGLACATVAVALTPSSERPSVLVLCVSAACMGTELVVTRGAPVAPLTVVAVLPIVVGPSGLALVVEAARGCGRRGGRVARAGPSFAETGGALPSPKTAGAPRAASAGRCPSSWGRGRWPQPRRAT